MFLPLFEQMRSAPLISSVGAKLYTLALDTPYAPPHPMAFIEPWQGNSDAGRALLDGYIICPNGAPSLAVNADSIALKTHTHIQAFKRLHSFIWLRDLRACINPQARSTARALLSLWLEHHATWNESTWTTPLCAARIYHSLSHFEWLGLDAHDPLSISLRHTISVQAAHIERAEPNALSPLAETLAWHVAMVSYAALSAQNPQLTQEAAARFDAYLNSIILPDGTVQTRRVVDLYHVIKALLTVRAVLTRLRLTPSVRLVHHVQQTVHALKFFIAPDGRPLHIQGTAEHAMRQLPTILQLCAQKTAYRHANRPVTSLDDGGFTHMVQNKTWVMTDWGMPHGASNASGAHASPAAFEFGVGKYRLITACGSHLFDAQFADMLRSTAAHSCAVLNDTNAFELNNTGGFGRLPTEASAITTTDANGAHIKMQHTSYMPHFNLAHTRRLHLAKHGLQLDGVDEFVPQPGKHDTGIAQSVDAAMRFHIHPSVQASLVRDGHAVLLKLPNGQGFQFTGHAQEELVLDSSIYCSGHPNPRRSQQIILRVKLPLSGGSVGWCFEGV